MSEPTDLDHAQMLARAFDRAWDRYYLDESGTLSKEVARSSLAKHLVALAKGGEKDERALAASGFLHLISLTEAPPRSTDTLAENNVSPTLFHIRIDEARAKFLSQWRVTGSSLSARGSPFTNLRVDNATAHFVREWRISVSTISFSNLTVSSSQ